MEVLSNSASLIISKHLSFKPQNTQILSTTTNLKFPISPNKNNPFHLSSSSSITFSPRTSATETSLAATTTSSTSVSPSSVTSDKRHWMVLMETHPQGLDSKAEVLDYYVKTLGRALGSEKDAQMCIYDASLETHSGFCCDIDEETSRELARVPGVLSVRPDPDFHSVKKDYDPSNIQSGALPKEIGTTLLFPMRNTKHWLVRMDKPGIGVVTKAQMVDYYVQILAKVLGNEKDAQMCIYHISWQSNFGFCCELDEECVQELAGVPGVLSVLPDKNFESENKDYGGNNLQSSTEPSYSEANERAPIKTKKLFVTGLSFYTSEKTLRSAFEDFGELVEVKIIMDKISKRSKGYAFIEYTTEEAASAALKEMNGKIINGWMIVVDAAKPRSSLSRYGRSQTTQS